MSKSLNLLYSFVIFMGACGLINPVLGSEDNRVEYLSVLRKHLQEATTATIYPVQAHRISSQAQVLQPGPGSLLVSDWLFTLNGKPLVTPQPSAFLPPLPDQSLSITDRDVLGSLLHQEWEFIIALRAHSADKDPSCTIVVDSSIPSMIIYDAWIPPYHITYNIPAQEQTRKHIQTILDKIVHAKP